MRDRRIHRVHELIACHHRGKVTLLRDEDFREWRRILMRDLTELEALKFGMASAMGLGRDSLNLRRWEKQFCKRLDFIDWTRLRDPTHLFGAAEAQKYVHDFLEVYRFRHPYMVSISTQWVTREMPDDPYCEPDYVDELIKVTLHAPRTPFDWVLGRLGEAKDEINIFKPGIIGLYGESDNFYLYIGDSCFHFGDRGVTELEQFDPLPEPVGDDDNHDEE